VIEKKWHQNEVPFCSLGARFISPIFHANTHEYFKDWSNKFLSSIDFQGDVGLAKL
jgi:hypothetical protein